MISCLPWHIWKYEIEQLPLSAKTLFANRGLEIERLEEELKSEGYLHLNEVLLEVLKEENRLTYNFNSQDPISPSDLGEFPEDWTEEDFIYHEGHKDLGG